MISILYIDDEPSHRDIGKRYLEKDGDFIVDTSPSAREAMVLPNLPQYDAIVSDYQMPAMDGIEFLKKIRSAGNNVPFILFTGKGREDVIIQALNERADFYLQKGGEPNTLFAEMRQDIRTAVMRRRGGSGSTVNDPDSPVKAATAGRAPGADEPAPGLQEPGSNPALEHSGNRVITPHESEVEHGESHGGDEKFRAYIENSPSGIFVTDRSGKYIDVNQSACTMTGYSKKELLSLTIKELVPKEKLSGLPDRLRELRETGRMSREIQLRKKDGTIITVMLNGVRLPDGTSIAFCEDITAKKQAEEALRESEEKYRILADAAEDIIYIIDPDDRVAYLNRYGLDLLNMNRGEVVGKPRRDLFREPEATRQYLNIRQVFTTGKPLRIESRINLPGREIWQDTKLVPLRSEKGTIIAVMGLSRDNTESKKALAELRFKNVILTTQMETSPDAILIVNQDGFIVNYNRKFLDMWGIPEDLIASGFDEPILQFVLRQLADPDAFLARVRFLYENKEEKSFEELRLKDGRILERFSSPMTGDEGKYYGRVWYFRDITDRKQAEGALRIANKKLTLLTGITRHDIRNQTLSLNAYLDLSKQSIGDAAVMRDYITREEQVVKTIERQILFTREYEKLGISAPVWQNIRSTVIQVTGEMDLTGIELDVDNLEDVEIYADALLRNVLTNMVDNSLRHGGDALKTIRFFSQISGTDLVIVCEDDGMGIIPEDRDFIFERGFGKNTGFGLFFIREILDITAIAIRETGEPGKGARFEIVVPKGAFRFPDWMG